MADERGPLADQSADVIRASVELAIARLKLKGFRATEAIDAPSDNRQDLDPAQQALVERVALAIPRAAARLPWRTDCLVQALAAQRWLKRHRITTTIALGVLRDLPPSFDAHAWLMAGGTVVTGGDVSGYVPFRR